MATQSPPPITRHDVMEDIDRWFFEAYLPEWVGIGSTDRDPRGILQYWGVPLHSASVHMNRWLTTDEAVIGLLEANHAPLREAGYSQTVVLDRRITVYNQDAASVDAIWSRRRADDSEIQKLAVHFEVHRVDGEWRVIGLASTHTANSRLADVWITTT